MVDYLDINDPDFPEKFINIVGVRPGDTIKISTPQFDRVENIVPENLERVDIEHLKTLSPEKLEALGCSLWEDNLWLLPYEWYGKIPEGTQLESILGRVFQFQSGVTSNDKRYGMLSYGFRTN